LNNLPVQKLLFVCAADVCRLRTFWAFRSFKLHPLTLGKALKALSLDAGVVDKQVWAIVLGNEAIPFGVIEPLDGSKCHRISPFIWVSRTLVLEKETGSAAGLLLQPASNE
jgi:hypothetical protein